MGSFCSYSTASIKYSFTCKDTAEHNGDWVAKCGDVLRRGTQLYHRTESLGIKLKTVVLLLPCGSDIGCA